MSKLRILVQPDGEKPRRLEEGFADELQLPDFLRDQAMLIPLDDIGPGTPPLLCIGYEVSVASGSEDLLYVDESGLLTVVETKLGRNPESRRKVVGQILEYAALTVGWSAAEIETRVNRFFMTKNCPEQYRGMSFEGAMRRFLETTNPLRLDNFAYDEFLNTIERNLQSGHIRLVIAVDEPHESLRKIVDFVNRFSEHFEMYLFQLGRFRDDALKSDIFVPAMFGQQPPRARKPWNWERYQAERGWSPETIVRVQAALERLTKIAVQWSPEPRFNQDWINLFCLGRSSFGVQVTKKGKVIEFWFPNMEDVELPTEVPVRRQPKSMYIRDDAELDDELLRTLCRGALNHIGVL